MHSRLVRGNRSVAGANSPSQVWAVEGGEGGGMVGWFLCLPCDGSAFILKGAAALQYFSNYLVIKLYCITMCFLSQIKDLLMVPVPVVLGNVDLKYFN